MSMRLRRPESDHLSSHAEKRVALVNDKIALQCSSWEESGTCEWYHFGYSVRGEKWLAILSDKISGTVFVAQLWRFTDRPSGPSGSCEEKASLKQNMDISIDCTVLYKRGLLGTQITQLRKKALGPCLSSRNPRLWCSSDRLIINPTSFEIGMYSRPHIKYQTIWQGRPISRLKKYYCSL